MQSHRVGDRTVLRVTGELDVATAPHLDAAAHDALSTGCPLVVDLSTCTFLDSTGARAVGLVARAGARAGAAVALVCPPSARIPRRVVDHVGLAVVVPVVDTLDEALRA
ncbi:anti-sigma B factor antagonist [Quadrisphaera sp. DSM 44207]|nr:anti-sigma B factor antagonist [Quadrisphaera sp. DSM 44207]